MRIVLGAMLGLLLLGAQPAHAYLLEPEHKEFFLRLQLGAGALENSVESTDVGGVSGTVGFALGGRIAKNLMLYGELLHQNAPDPGVRVGGKAMGAALDSSISLSGVGPGLAYYFTPVNIYLSGTAMMAWASVSESGSSVRTDPGFGARLSLGKEWWVSRDWGLGLALVGNLATIPTDGGPSMTSKGLSLAFSATLN